MPCLEHDWFLTTACPTCDKAAIPEAPEPPPPVVEDPPTRVETHPGPPDASAPTEAETPYIEPPLPAFYCCETADIPPFLLRRPGGGLVHPSLRGTVAKAVPKARAPVVERSVRDWTDAELHAASLSMAAKERQPIIREMHRRADIAKAREAKLKKKTAHLIT